MRKLPRKAQIFLIAVIASGALCAAATRFVEEPRASASVWELVVLIVLATLAGSRKVTLVRSARREDEGSMSLGFAITFAALLRFGPDAALVVGAVSNLSGCIYPRRQTVHQLLFNVALTAASAWGCGIAFMFLNHHSLALSPIISFPAVCGACLIYFAINTGAVATIIGLCTSQHAGRLWKQTFLWTAPGYFAAASITTVAILVCGHQVGAVFLFGAPVAYLTYQSYAIYTARAEEKQQHIEELEGSQKQLSDLYLATIKSLALAIDAKDQYTHQHILRVQRYALATAKYMGLNGSDLEGLTTGALLHDIGKLGVPEYVLLKPGRLTDEEFAKIKKHPEIGASILDPVEFPWPVVPVVKYHHEKWDGSGYPEGLKGEEIPLTARVLAVCDVYDALTSNRSYRNAWTHAKAIALIQEQSGKHFDPTVASAFLEVIDDVVRQMAAEGYGPLANEAGGQQSTPSKTAQAVKDIQRASSELWALYEVAQTLSASLGLHETLEILGRKLEAILPGVACLFLLREEHSGDLIAHAAIGVNRDFFADCRTFSQASASRRVAERQESYLGPYDPDDLMLSSVDAHKWTSLRSAIIVPVVHQGDVLGTINLYHPNEDAFMAHDLQLLETIAERAALAVYNGMLFDRTQSHAFTDPLTDLYNVRYLTQYLNRCCAKGDARPDADGVSVPVPPERFALLCMDLDSFKPINDNFGHQKGDQVLRDLSRIFRSTVRETDIVARYGGDEFIIVLQNAGALEAERMCGRLQEAVAQYDPGLIHPKLGALHLGVSIGTACYPEDGSDYATLLSAADVKMYADKTERKLGRLASLRDERTLAVEAA